MILPSSCFSVGKWLAKTDFLRKSRASGVVHTERPALKESSIHAPSRLISSPRKPQPRTRPRRRPWGCCPCQLSDIQTFQVFPSRYHFPRIGKEYKASTRSCLNVILFIFLMFFRAIFVCGWQNVGTTTILTLRILLLQCIHMIRVRQVLSFVFRQELLQRFFSDFVGTQL